jgi:hypothetical protein
MQRIVSCLTWLLLFALVCFTALLLGQVPRQQRPFQDVAPRPEDSKARLLKPPR